MRVKRLILNKCEIEGCIETKNLQKHHIIERTEINCTNHNDNLAILCACHHAAHHSGDLKILGVYPSTKLPNYRVLIYEIDGKKNIDVPDTYLEFKNKSYKI